MVKQSIFLENECKKNEIARNYWIKIDSNREKELYGVVISRRA
jgi:hypothetical protein